MTLDGTIKIARALASHKIWTMEPFDRRAAWLDLLMLANTDTASLLVRDTIVTLEPGQVGWSQVRLAERWEWGRTKVNSFLKWLHGEGMISFEENNLTTIITITNYTAYQSDLKIGDESSETAPAEHRASIGPAPGQHRPCTESGEGRGDTHTRGSANADPQVEEVRTFAASWPGDLRSGISGPMDDGWACEWVAYQTRDGSKLPDNWRTTIVLRYIGERTNALRYKAAGAGEPFKKNGARAVVPLSEKEAAFKALGEAKQMAYGNGQAAPEHVAAYIALRDEFNAKYGKGEAK